MDQAFRVRKDYRNLGLVCLAFFLALAVGSVCLLLAGGDDHQGKLACGLSAGFWSCWVAASAGMLLAYARQSLRIDGDHFTQTGIRGTGSAPVLCGISSICAWRLQSVALRSMAGADQDRP